jgi:hypothetical protein
MFQGANIRKNWKGVARPRGFDAALALWCGALDRFWDSW